MKNNSPKISIIVPCRNEGKYIDGCLASIIAGDFPQSQMEVLIVDGMSDDGTRNWIRKYSQNYHFIKLLNNPQKTTSAALNIGVQMAIGDYIIILSSHAEIEKKFIGANVDALEEYAADCVGGVITTLPAIHTLLAQSIALALSHPFGVGNSYFRIGSLRPKYVDTVPFACYRREVFKRIGLFDEALVRNQDIEFNLRLKKAGGKILLNPKIISYYHARPNLKELFKQNFDNGFWVIFSLRFAKLPFSIRHIVPCVFVLALLSSFAASLIYWPFIYVLAFAIVIYAITAILVSCKLSLQKGFKYFPFLILTFFALHFSYGLGSLWGMVKVLNKEGKAE